MPTMPQPAAAPGSADVRARLEHFVVLQQFEQAEQDQDRTTERAAFCVNLVAESVPDEHRGHRDRQRDECCGQRRPPYVETVPEREGDADGERVEAHGQRQHGH